MTCHNSQVFVGFTPFRQVTLPVDKV